MIRNAVGFCECQHIKPRMPASGNLSHLIYMLQGFHKELIGNDMYGLVNHLRKAQMFARGCLHRNRSSFQSHHVPA